MSTENSEMSIVLLLFGELFIEERTTWNTPYKFSGKELDEETGYNYFGARYYDPSISIWLSVDPNAHLRVEWTPYNAMRCNPILNIDPDGALDTDFKDKEGNLISHVDDGSNAVFQLKGTNQTNEYFEFTGYNDQGGKNEISVAGAITGAQDYVLTPYFLDSFIKRV